MKICVNAGHTLNAAGSGAIGIKIESMETRKVAEEVDVIKNKALPLPIVVEGEHIITISSKKTLDEAGRTATIYMHKFLVNELKMDTYEAGMLLSLVGDLKVCQVVNPLITARMELPKYILDNYKYELV